MSLFFITWSRTGHFTTTNEGNWIQEMFGRRPSHLRILASSPAVGRGANRSCLCGRKRKCEIDPDTLTAFVQVSFLDSTVNYTH